jgi:hypothetical protein
MKGLNTFVIFFCLNFQNSYAQFNVLKFAPESSIDYGLSAHITCTANVFEIEGGAGSPYIGMENFGLGLGLSLRDKTVIPELIANYTKTFYIFDFGLRSKISLNGNEKYYVISPTFGVSMFGFFGVFYSRNFGVFSNDYMSKHTIGMRFLISNELHKKGE